jgi:hypothetical protein
MVFYNQDAKCKLEHFEVEWEDVTGPERITWEPRHHLQKETLEECSHLPLLQDPKEGKGDSNSASSGKKKRGKKQSSVKQEVSARRLSDSQGEKKRMQTEPSTPARRSKRHKGVEEALATVSPPAVLSAPPLKTEPVEPAEEPVQPSGTGDQPRAVHFSFIVPQKQQLKEEEKEVKSSPQRPPLRLSFCLPVSTVPPLSALASATAFQVHVVKLHVLDDEGSPTGVVAQDPLVFSSKEDLLAAAREKCVELAQQTLFQQWTDLLQWPGRGASEANTALDVASLSGEQSVRLLLSWCAFCRHYLPLWLETPEGAVEMSLTMWLGNDADNADARTHMRQVLRDQHWEAVEFAYNSDTSGDMQKVRLIAHAV